MNVPELWRKTENVQTEGDGHDPLGHRTDDMEHPATVRGVPVTGIFAIVLDVRYNAGNCDQQEEYGAYHRQDESEVGNWQRGCVGVQVVREHCLNAEIHRSKAEAEECAKEMHNADVGLLEVGHYADA